MEDLLKKIKLTENDAQSIVSKSEDEANRMLDKIKSECSKKIGEAKRDVHEKYTKIKETEINSTGEKRDSMVSEKINAFNKSFGDIDSKKRKSEDYLIKIIKDRIGF